MTGKVKYTNDIIRAALKETKGMVYLAARQIGCTPETIYLRMKRSPELAALHTALHGEVGDVAELRLYKAIQDGEHWAIAFYLKTKGRHRGYTEKIEIAHDPIDWRVVPDDVLTAYCDGKLSLDDVHRSIVRQSRAREG